ncbi:MAG: endolytic transglycosylase MltG [Alphaproteobacteria bacterium]|nr:endolytic transglycosylase MltG [Alphaproteobacteria bacterium]
MKIILYKILLSLVILALASICGVGWFFFDKFKTPGTINAPKIVAIPKGFGTMQIGEILARENVISNNMVFAVAAKILPPPQSLKAGEYEFTPGITMREVIEKLKKGDVYKRNFTIAEGLTSYEIVQKLSQIPELKPVTEGAEIPAEGSLLPQTYQYVGGETIDQKIAQMRESMTKILDKEWAGRADNLPFKTKEEAVILASIVEKETGVAAERQRIAGVFINRLRQNIPLQSDPTIIYALTKGQPENKGQGPLGRRLLSKDLEISSPYNTYKMPGLPPGPICNPGAEAIHAALHPEQHAYIYFVADGSGGHVFATTLSEHNRNVENWRDLRRNNKK